MTIYEKIDKLLEEQHMSRRELARRAGIKETTLAAAFARRPEHFPLKFAKPISEVLGVSLDTLYGRALGSYGDTIGEAFKNAGDPEARKRILLEVFEQMNANGQNTLIERAKDMLEVKRYTEPEPKVRETIEWTVTRSDGSTDK